MFLAILKNNETNKTYHKLYASNEWGLFATDTFCPDIEPVNIIDFKASGKTYSERKSHVQGIAVDFSLSFSEIDTCYSFSELCDIETWFKTMGKRYGLLQEFKENGIC